MIPRESIVEFSTFVEDFKIQRRFESYKDTLEEILRLELFDFIHINNIRGYLTDDIKRKLFDEYADRNMIKPEHFDRVTKIF